MKKLKEQWKIVSWALHLAIQINGKVLALWLTIGAVVAVLPAISLRFNREAVAVLSTYLTTGQGSFPDIVPSILALGVTMVLIGVSSRVNQGLLYLVMYDDYYLGFSEYLIDFIQTIELKTLMGKDYKDEYLASMMRAGAMADLLSTSVMIVSRSITVI